MWYNLYTSRLSFSGDNFLRARKEIKNKKSNGTLLSCAVSRKYVIYEGHSCHKRGRGNPIDNIIAKRFKLLLGRDEGRLK